MGGPTMTKGGKTLPSNDREFLYVMPPIDNWDGLGWQDLPTDWRADAACKAVQRAMLRIRRHGWWEEPPALGPKVMPLPSEDNEGSDVLRWAVGVKISNNGTTFVWSPTALPWLDQYSG